MRMTMFTSIFLLVHLTLLTIPLCDGASTSSPYSTRSHLISLPNTGKCNIRAPVRCPSSPPCQCYVDNQCRKVVECIGLNSIPVSGMDPQTMVLNITAPQERPNQLKLGQIFHHFSNLTEVHITSSAVKAIGERTFCQINYCFDDCALPIKVLNLSSNSLAKITSTDDFECLTNLRVLDLANNMLNNSLSSGIFSKLTALEHLSLARNRITELAPAIFMELKALKLLDMSNNLLVEVSNSMFHHLENLKRLNLQGNKIFKIRDETFKDFHNLEELDLSNNRIRFFSAKTFTILKSLRVLRLNGNILASTADRSFLGLSLDLIDLSHNQINPITACTFCDMKALKRLRLSGNMIGSFNGNLLTDVADSLDELVLDNNTNLVDVSSSLSNILLPLRRLRRLSLVSMNLDENLPDSTFDHLKSLTFLNLSVNSFRELSSRLIAPLASLDVLDFSNNLISFIDPSTLQTLSKMQYLSRVYLHENPYSCYRCHILPFIDWLNVEDPLPYWKVCPRLTEDPSRRRYCARCSAPSTLTTRYLDEQNLINDLEFCTNPEVQLRISTSEPQVGLILAFLIIITLIVVIGVIIYVYRKHGAVYYTQEGKLNSNDKIYAGSLGSPELGGVRPHTWGHRVANHSMTSTNLTLSRQGTVFSPQSSLEQQQTHPLSPPGVTELNNYHVTYGCNGHHQVAVTNGQQQTVCDSCANSPQVKQVIASLPAMTEMIENRVVTTATNGGASAASAIIITTAMTTTTRSLNGGHVSLCNNRSPIKIKPNENGEVQTIPKTLFGSSNGTETGASNGRMALLNEIKLDFVDDNNYEGKYNESEDATKVHIYI